jgi:hypothetical protein
MVECYYMYFELRLETHSVSSFLFYGRYTGTGHAKGCICRIAVIYYTGQKRKFHVVWFSVYR